MPLPEASARRLMEIARASIAHGLDHNAPLAVSLTHEPPELLEKRAAFVTLHLHGQLRGCIGAIEATQPLAEDVAIHAYSAAFEDPRFAPVTRAEADQLTVHISILTTPEPLLCDSEADLIRQLRPGRDGLILREGRARSTFLPAVWEDLSEPRLFLAHLKQKAGLPADYWSDHMHFWRYQAESIH